MPTYGRNIADNIASYVQTIYEDALLVARDQSIVPALVRNFNDRSGTAIRTRSEYGTVTYGQVSDADDLTSQVFSPSTQQSLTPYEYGGQFFISDTRIETDSFAVRDDASQELGAGAAQKVQMDICGQFSSLTGGTVGSAGGTVTWGQFFGALALLRQQNAPGPYYCVLQPGQWFHLGTAVVPAGAAVNAPDFQDAVMRDFWQMTVAGVSIFTCNDVTTGTAATGGMFSRDAIGYDLRRAFRIEPERDASRRGWELNASMLYAAGVWRPKWGVQMVATSVVPST